MSATLLQRIRARLEQTYGDRLKGLMLYGSEARGEAKADSDIDLLVLLEGPLMMNEEIKRTVDAIYPLQLEETGRPIHALPVDAAHYHSGRRALYRNVRREGIVV